MRAHLRYQPTTIPCIQAYKIDRLENRQLPIDRADWDKGCDRIDFIFFQHYRLAVLCQIVTSLPGGLVSVAGVAMQDLIVLSVGIALFFTWVVVQCFAFNRFQAWMEAKMSSICDDMERSPTNTENASFVFSRIRGACGCDSEYFVKIQADDERATVASSSSDDESDDESSDNESSIP
mmetsp:Transcript_14199/g.21662  ORF Transcript_14199/g.21662 Transcript_14199/m.21662 type:complete len:178 (-) Transcript_14199:154-687(-)